MPRCSFTVRPDGLALHSPYDPAFVAAFKASLSSRERAWDATRKVWVISPDKAMAVVSLCETFFGEAPTVPQIDLQTPVTPQIRTFQVEYLGQCKTRNVETVATAMGSVAGAWSLIAPEPVLRAWFEPPTATAPAQPGTLYGVLGVAQTATEQEIKAGYRRMARQWHPDANHEPGAHEMFLRIADAYNVLSDPLLRKRYNAGLLFEQRDPSRRPQRVTLQPEHYRAPLTCGLIVAEALPRLGRWELVKILAWNDITDGAGRVMVASWDRDRERIIVNWVQP